MSIELKTITYIGPPPKRRSPLHGLGGWVLLLFAGGIGFMFVKPLVPFLMAQQSEASEQNAETAIGSLKDGGGSAGRLAAAALERTRGEVQYDPGYHPIEYPGGDLPADRGSGADLVVRSYRALGVDLQQLVHEDMKQNFRSYPQYWRRKSPDPNIDHRRVPNLQRFLSRYGKALPVARDVDEFAVGDVVVWRLPYASNGDGARHIGVVVPGPGAKSHEMWVVHNEGAGPEWDDDLFRYEVIGHYRFLPGDEAVTSLEEEGTPDVLVE